MNNYVRKTLPRYILVITDKDEYLPKGSVWENVSGGKYMQCVHETDGPCLLHPDSYINRATAAHTNANTFSIPLWGDSGLLNEGIDWVEIPEQIYPYLNKTEDKFVKEFKIVRVRATIEELDL